MKTHSRIKQLLTQIQRLLLPYHCILCQQSTQRPLDLCAQCETQLCQTETLSCQLCATPLYGKLNLPVCGNCLKKPPHYDRLICIGYYENHLARLISQLKFHQRLNISKILGELMITTIRNNHIQKPEIIVPVPLHKKRLRQRGFNQAAEIAKPIAQQLKVPINTTNCQRIRNTQPQTHIEAKKRPNNVRNSFSCHFNNPPKAIAIVDDVFTTGSTVNELSRTLKKAGVKQIEVWCIAKTLLFRKK